MTKAETKGLEKTLADFSNRQLHAEAIRRGWSVPALGSISGREVVQLDWLEEQYELNLATLSDLGYTKKELSGREFPSLAAIKSSVPHALAKLLQERRGNDVQDELVISPNIYAYRSRLYDEREDLYPLINDNNPSLLGRYDKKQKPKFKSTVSFDDYFSGRNGCLDEYDYIHGDGNPAREVRQWPVAFALNESFYELGIHWLDADAEYAGPVSSGSSRWRDRNLRGLVLNNGSVADKKYWLEIDRARHAAEGRIVGPIAAAQLIQLSAQRRHTGGDFIGGTTCLVQYPEKHLIVVDNEADKAEGLNQRLQIEAYIPAFQSDEHYQIRIADFKDDDDRILRRRTEGVRRVLPIEIK